MLRNLQGNILKGHGRDNTWNIFFQFGDDVAASKRLIREVANSFVTDAYKQLLENEQFKTTATGGETFSSFFISPHGYSKLGFKFEPPAGNTIFEQGMQGQDSIDFLADPPPSGWDDGLKEKLHAMILVADDDTSRGSIAVGKLHTLLKASGATNIFIQPGKAIRNSAGNGIEHFGYLDGRSQPLMLLEDIEQESRDGGIANWNPAAPLEIALVADPLAADSEALGSFFVFRKLEELGKRSTEHPLTGVGLSPRFAPGRRLVRPAASSTAARHRVRRSSYRAAFPAGP